MVDRPEASIRRPSLDLTTFVARKMSHNEDHEDLPTHAVHLQSHRKQRPMKVDIPKHSLHASEAESIRTPKTPQNEGLIWFESEASHGLVQVYEVTLEADGGPHKDRVVSGSQALTPYRLT